jgi:endonuclease III
VNRQSQSSTLSASELARLKRVARLLSKTYHEPRLGNKDDSLDELIYIILSGKTAEGSFSRTYRALHSAFPNWFTILKTRRGAVARIIKRGGLSMKKEGQIRGLLSNLERSGVRNLRRALEPLSDRDAERLLTALPGVGLKTARCVLMYSLSRHVFPVDANVNRVLSRLGFAAGRRLTDDEHNEIQSRIPPRLRYSLHVNLVAHGRAVCRPVRPACDRCRVEPVCPGSNLGTGR